MGRHKLNNVGVGNMKQAYADIPEGRGLLFNVAVTSSNESKKVIPSLSKRRNTLGGSHHDAKIIFPLAPAKISTLSKQRPHERNGRMCKKVNYGSRLTGIENGPIDIDRVTQKEFAEAVFNFLAS
jgi:hypothetical protein